MAHNIHIDTFPGRVPEFRWVCTCGAKGNIHDDHQTALNHGIIHTWISAPATRQIEREGGQA